MGVTTIFDFSTPSNYALTNIGVSGAIASLLRNQVSAPISVTSNFGTTSDYTYDNTKIQIAANQANLLDIGPTGGCTFFGSFASSVNADFSSGVGTGTLVGGATITGGYLNVNGAGKAATWASAGNVTPLVQTGCVRFIYNPKYNNHPGANQFLYISNVSGGTVNCVQIVHLGSGNVSAIAYDNAGTAILTCTFLWNAVSGTDFEWEFDFDLTGGHAYLFLNGALVASAVGTGTRSGSANAFGVGTNQGGGTGTTQFAMKNLAVFPTMQHTSGFASPVANPVQHIYNTASPTIGFTTQAVSDVFLNKVTNVTATIVASGGDSITFTASVNGGSTFIWWNGVAWATSSGVAQSNSLATFVANLATLPLVTTFELQAFLTSGAGTTTPVLSNVVVTYNDFIYVSGTIQSNSGFTAEEVVTFAAVLSQSGADTVTFGLVVNGQLMYWTGSAWANSNGTFAQTNAFAVINTNAPTLLTVNSTVKVFALLVSGSGTTTPSLTSMTVQYNFGELEPTAPPTCIVTGFIRDIQGNPVVAATVAFFLVNSQANAYCEGSSHVLLQSTVSTVTDANGYFEQPVLVSSFEGSNTSIQVTITKGAQKQTVGPTGQPLTLIVPNQQSVDITTLLTA